MTFGNELTTQTSSAVQQNHGADTCDPLAFETRNEKSIITARTENLICNVGFCFFIFKRS